MRSGCLKGAATLALMLLSLHAGAAVKAMDGAGNNVQLNQPAARIVALSPHAAELVDNAGAGARLVAVTDEADYPASVAALPKVGGYGRWSIEAIARARPDLVIMWQDGATPDLAARLKSLGVAVFVSHPVRVQDIATEVRSLGVLAGTKNIASQNALNFDAAVTELARLYAKRAPVKTFIAVSDAPVYTVSAQSFLGQLVNQCGGDNIFGALAAPAAQVSVEAVARAQPEVVLSTTGIHASWRKWPLRAFDDGYVFQIRQASRPSFRLLEAMIQVCGTLDAVRQGR